MSDKRVSIIMPAYNNGAFIGAAIESVLAQTHAHWELLIVDDASSDDTLAQAEQFQTKGRFLKCVSMSSSLASERSKMTMRCRRAKQSFKRSF